MPEAKTRKMKREKETQTNKTRRNDWNRIFYNWRCAYLCECCGARLPSRPHLAYVSIGKTVAAPDAQSTLALTLSVYAGAWTCHAIQSQKSLLKRIPNKWKIDTQLCIREISGGFCPTLTLTNRPDTTVKENVNEEMDNVRKEQQKSEKAKQVPTNIPLQWNSANISMHLCISASRFFDPACTDIIRLGMGNECRYFMLWISLYLYRIHLNAGCVGVYSISYHITMVTATMLVWLFSCAVFSLKPVLQMSNHTILI